MKSKKRNICAMIKDSILKHKKRYPNQTCIFKTYNTKFPRSKEAKEIREYNKNIILTMLKKQKNSCALTGRFIDESDFSIDRINPEIGYCEGNIQLTTWEANRFKRDYSEGKLFDLCLSIFRTLGLKDEYSYEYYDFISNKQLW